jgi:Heparinase II/III-like protein
MAILWRPWLSCCGILQEAAMFLFGSEIRQQLRRRIARSAAAKGLASAILARAGAMLGEDGISQQYEPERHVLLPTTRRFADRSQHLILAWLLTGEARFVKQVVDDLMAVTAFPDWNRTHFLDVAEMVSAVAMARQWTVLFLSSEQKNSIDKAIIEKGLVPAEESLRGGSEWTITAGNWNIVCNSAIILVALTMVEAYSKICGEVLKRAQASLAVGMKAVGPTGEWFEGLTYWSFAAHHAALAQIAVDQSGYLLENPALFDPILRGGTFAAASVGPSGLGANFGDSLTRPELCPMHAWLSVRNGRKLPAALAGTHPFELVWARDDLLDPGPPKAFIGKHLVALRLQNPLAWLAVSVGTADHAHAHHDLGSFIWETDGVRFVVDPGRLDYALKGYFSAERFDHFGASAAAHNLPLFDPASMLGWRADVEYCLDTDDGLELTIRSTSPSGNPAITRRFRLLNDGGLVLEDWISPDVNLEGQKLSAWQFHTDAGVEIDDDRLLLRKLGRSVLVHVSAAGKGAWEVRPIDVKSLGLVDAGSLTCASFKLPEVATDTAVVVRFHAIDRD